MVYLDPDREREYQKEYREKHKERLSAYFKEYRKKNKERIATKKKEWHEANRDKVLARIRKWRKNNPDYNRQYAKANKESIAHNRREWVKKNQWRRANIEAKREAIKISALLPTSDFDLINKFYQQRDLISRETSIQHHVDHIIPLSKGGAHHQDNLQIITATENLSKHDKYDPSLGGVWANNELAKVTKTNLGI